MLSSIWTWAIPFCLHVLLGMGGHGFKPRPGHTKVLKNGTNCSSLVAQTYGIELGLVDSVSV